jgi:putative ATP-dependent endonuclease of the OLD family
MTRLGHRRGTRGRVVRGACRGLHDRSRAPRAAHDFRTAGDPTIARLSYIFRKKADVTGISQSSDDCEFVVFGGGDEARPVPSKVSRRIAIDVLDALRDAEGQLGAWRSSPLRPLLEDAISGVTRADLDTVAAELDKATKTLETFPTIKALENELRAGILHLSGKAHDIDARLRFAASDPLRLFRAIAIFIDGGKRGIAEASLGSANVALLALKLGEFAWRRKKNERNFSLLCIEDAGGPPPSATPAFCFQKAASRWRCSASVDRHQPFADAGCRHAPAVDYPAENARSVDARVSLADLPVTPDELDDLETYLDATRAEMLFARGVIYAEGDAEEALVPVFSSAIGHVLDEHHSVQCGWHEFRTIRQARRSSGHALCGNHDWDPLDGTKNRPSARNVHWTSGMTY